MQKLNETEFNSFLFFHLYLYYGCSTYNIVHLNRLPTVDSNLFLLRYVMLTNPKPKTQINGYYLFYIKIKP